MYFLYGVRRIPYRHESVTEDVMVATFDTFEAAISYIKKSQLKDTRKYVFSKQSVLHEFQNAFVSHVPHNPRLKGLKYE